MAKYGRKEGSSYAVVTGGSEGLGLELCDQLAEQGFNITMVSRNIAKIESRIEALQQKYPTIKFKAVAADCSTKTTVQEYTDLIENELADLDIGIWCVNAGCWLQGPTDLIDDASFERVFGLNGLHVVYMVKALLPKLKARSQKSAILVTSSSLANVAMPGLSAYCTTKAMVSTFAEALSFEIREWADVTAWELGPCDTNLFSELPAEDMKFRSLMKTPPQAVAGVLRQLGRTRKTNGNYFYYILSSFGFPPLGLIGPKAAKEERTRFIR